MGNKNIVIFILVALISTSALGQSVIDFGDINSGSNVLDPLFDMTTIGQKDGQEVARGIVKLEILEVEDGAVISGKKKPFEQFIYRDLEEGLMKKKAPIIINNIDEIMK